MDTKDNPSEPPDPLQDIGLSFSGGGFRAAAFSLGVLSYLSRIFYDGNPLLTRVRFITSTSGGTFTNAYYAQRLCEGEKDFDFETFYKALRLAMGGEELLKEAFEQLETARNWPEQGKQHNLINAFAKAYDKKLFNKATLGTLVEMNPGVTSTEAGPPWNPHLEKVCFNTTELNNGLNFYFKADCKDKCVDLFGNNYLRFKDGPAMRRLKLSDIVAASSCFPAGFEPILFPDDFVYPGNSNLNELTASIIYDHNLPDELDDIRNKPFSLMDGGITDNMGLHALEIEDDQRAKKGKPFDLMISCDVTSYFNKAFQVKTSRASWWKRWLTVQFLVNAWKFSWFIFLACIAALFFRRYEVPALLLLLPSLSGGLLYVYFRIQLRKLERANTGAWSLAFGYVRRLLKLPLSRLLPLLSLRGSSTVKLVTDLFLKQARRNQYDGWFSRTNNINRALACLTYEFSTVQEKRRLENLEERDSAWWPTMKPTLTPSVAIQKYADEARSMGTTLWFAEQDKDKRDIIIATGQFTICYSLIKQICRLEVENPRYAEKGPLQTLKKFLLIDWSAFQGKPGFMLENLKAE
ncbi:MAG TPA: patatin-like phospholipase family protein [Puia sp.]|nr:patatin-like phospholipase family protein [Puia sp.]